jgi:hypothetical protein
MVNKFLNYENKMNCYFIQIFRQKRHRARVNSNQNINDDSSSPSHKETNNDERNTLLKRLEQSNERVNFF